MSLWQKIKLFTETSKKIMYQNISTLLQLRARPTTFCPAGTSSVLLFVKFNFPDDDIQNSGQCDIEANIYILKRALVV